MFSVIAMGLGVALAATAAVAEDDTEVPSGTFSHEPRPGSAVDPVARWTGRQAPVLIAEPSADEELEELFSDALAELEAGRSWEAQRLFERLVARAPESSIADDARRYLVELYKAPIAPRKDAVGSADGRLKSGRAAHGSAPVDGWRAEERAPAAAQAEAPVSRQLEDDFIADAGDRVFFSSGSAEIGARARSVLAAQARFIKRRPDLTAVIEGHADDQPLTPRQHEELSGERAEAVRQRLISEGVEPDRLTVVAWGREHRVSNCPDAACAVQNRRAVTVLGVRGARRPNGPLGAAPGGGSFAGASRSVTQ
jgi:peptidoglycan-associated lipoprotein